MACNPINLAKHLIVPTYRNGTTIWAYRGGNMSFTSPQITADSEGDFYLSFDDGGNLASPAPSNLTLFTDFAFTQETGEPHLSGYHDAAGDWGISHEISGTGDIVTWLLDNGTKDGIHTGFIPEANARIRVATSIDTDSGTIRTYIGGLLVAEETRTPAVLQAIIAELTHYHVGKLGGGSPLAGTVRIYSVAAVARALSATAMENATDGGFSQLFTSDEEEVLFTG